MDPTQKKCMIGSAVTHSALLVTAVLVSAFAGREKPPEQFTPLTIFNLNGINLTDGETRNGGAPTVAAVPLPRVNPLLRLGLHHHPSLGILVPFAQ